MASYKTNDMTTKKSAKKQVFNIKKGDLKDKSNLVILDVSAIGRTGYKPLGTKWSLSTMINNLEFNTSTLYNILRQFTKFGVTDNVDYIFAFDTPHGILKKVDEHYKNNRVSWNDDYFSQTNTLMKNLQDAGFTVLAEPGYEADHVIHEAVKQNHDLYDQLFIVTNDMDLSSMIDDKVTWVNTIKSRGDIDRAHYEERVKAPYNSILLKKCLVGDKSDNILGVYRFGPKKFDTFYANNVPEGTNVRGHEVEVIKNSDLSDDEKGQALHASELVLPLPVKVDARATPFSAVNLNKFTAFLNLFAMATIVKAFNKYQDSHDSEDENKSTSENKGTSYEDFKANQGADMYDAF